jgi:hypothetical protein
MRLRLEPLLLIAVVGLGGLNAAGSEHPWNELGAISRTFLETVAAGKSADAWMLMNDATRNQLPRKDFVTMMGGFEGSFGALQRIETTGSEWIDAECGRIIEHVTYEHGEFHFTFELCREKENWRIAFLGAEPLRFDREVVSKNAVLWHLRQHDLPEPLSVDCPGAGEAAEGSVVRCQALIRKGCVVTVSLISAHLGFATVSTPEGERCARGKR